MKRLVLGFFKLLLQLLIFAVTGNWVRIGEREREVAPPRSARQRERDRRRAQPKRAPGQRRIFDARGRPARMPGRADAWEAVTLEQLEAARAYEQSLEAQFVGEPEGGERAKRQRRGERAPKPVAAPEALPRSRSLAQALRDPRTLRQAIVLGAALSPRRSR